MRRGPGSWAPALVLACACGALAAAPAAAAKAEPPAPSETAPPAARPAAPNAPAPAGAEIKVEARLDKDRAALGEPILLTVIARPTGGIEWEPRSVGAKAGSFDVEQVKGPEPLPAGKNAPGAEPATRWVFRLAAFELGEQELPPIDLRYSRGGSSQIETVSTPALKIHIVPTLTDKDEKPADIRHGFTLPRDWRFWILLGAGLLAAGALVYALVRRLRRRRKPASEAPVPGPPPRPAYDRYLEQLEALLAEKLIESGKYRELHVRIAEIVKPYLGEVLGFDAVDRTSWEMNLELGAVGAAAPVRSETRSFLDACDAVKFAKHVPGVEQMQETAARARRILDLARPSPPLPAGESAPARAAGSGGAA